jgi:hypothetical protein
MRVLFYYRGSEHIGVESIISYLKSKGHLVELIYEPALGDNGYIDIPFLNNFFYNEKLIVDKAIRFRPDLIALALLIRKLYMPIKNCQKFKKRTARGSNIVGGYILLVSPDEHYQEKTVSI